VIGKVKLHDIEDAEAFVRSCLAKARIRLVKGSQENEELVCEGLVLLCEMAGRFDGRWDREKHKEGMSFASWASIYLPKRLNDAYYALHPEHVKYTDEEGRQRYRFGIAPGSWDGMQQGGGEEGGGIIDERSLRHVGEFVHPRVAA